MDTKKENGKLKMEDHAHSLGRRDLMKLGGSAALGEQRSRRL